MKKVKAGKSKIHGNGLIADEPIRRGDVIELVHTIREIEPGVKKTTPTLLGRNYNHSEEPNSMNVIDGNNRYLVALKEIEVGGEITTDYRNNPDLEQPDSFTSNDNYISFDYDDTLTTPEGFKLAKQMVKDGNNLYVITARDKMSPQMIERAEAAGIPKENIILAGSDEQKVKIVKENNISKHIDNKDSVIKALGKTGKLFNPDEYPDLKADFIEMDLSDEELNQLKKGGFIIDQYPDGGITTQQEIDVANKAMMKAKLAYADMQGNPAAKRMIVASDKPYDFGNGMIGTHYMASMDDYAVPQIQDVNGQLILGDYGPDSAEAIKFDNPEDAQYFAENYKNVSPAFLNEKKKGGIIKYPDGGENNGDEPKGRKKTKFQKGTYDPNETAGYMLDEQEVVVPGKATNWGKATIDYRKRNSEEDFVNKKKKQYLKKNKGLNELYGINMENFPQDVEENFRNEYDYNKNTAVVKKVGRQEGWNPNKRTQYVDDLNDTQRGIVAESKYGSKLQPTYWDRTLAGLATLGSKFSPELRDAMNKGYMPGLTQKESQEILNSKMTKIPFTDIDLPFAIPTGGLESFAALEIPGVLPANYIKNRGLTTGSNYKQMPSWYTGEKMANVEDKDVMASNILSYAGLEALPELGVNLAKGSYKLAKSGAKGLKSGYVNVAEGANPFNYAWKSPAARFDNTVGYAQTIDDMPMSQQLFESIKSDPNLSFEDKILLKQYEMDSRPFTGRGGRKINQEARAQLDNLIEKSRISSDQPIVLSRRINASNKELFDAANKTYKPERPTSWSAGRDNLGNEGYGSASDRMVIKLPKGREHTVLKNPYQALTENELEKFAADLKAKGTFDDVIENQLSFMKGNRASERELLLPSDAELRKIGKVKNDLGGYDFIMKPKRKSDFSILQKELPGSPNTFKSSLGSMDMSRYEIKNPDYFTQLLNTYDSRALSAANKKFYKGLIDSVKKQKGIATERQYNELQRLKTGNFNFGKKGYSDGGLINQFENLRTNSKLNKFIR